MIKHGLRTTGGMCEFVISSKKEVAELSKEVSQGSTAFCIEGPAIYMFDESKNEWVEL